MTDHTPEFTQPQLPFGEIPYGYCACGCGQKTRIPTRNDTSNGFVKGEPVRFIGGHNARLRGHAPIEEIFWKKVKVGSIDECWIWQAALNEPGYGHLRFDEKDYYAHRLSYELQYGPIPDGMNVLHKCDNPPCCNWSHLFLGSHVDNVADKVSKGRQQRGERHGTAKLTELDVLEIRRLHRDGMSQTAISHQFGVIFQHVHSIVRYKSWKHLP